jgi:hypothetical protein
MTVIPSLIQTQWFVYLNALLFVVCANRSSLFSSSSLYCKLADDFKLVNRSYVIGSMTQDASVFTNILHLNELINVF